MDFYIDCGIPFAYTIELPDFGQFGFLMRPSEVKSISNGLFTGLQRMGEELLEELKINPDILKSSARKDYTVTTSTEENTSSTLQEETSTTPQQFATSTVSSTTMISSTECCDTLELKSTGRQTQF